MYPGSKKEQKDETNWIPFSGMQTITEYLSHVYKNVNAGKYWMQTCGGFYIEVFNPLTEKWVPDGDGCGVKGYGAGFRIL